MREDPGARRGVRTGTSRTRSEDVADVSDEHLATGVEHDRVPPDQHPRDEDLHQLDSAGRCRLGAEPLLLVAATPHDDDGRRRIHLQRLGPVRDPLHEPCVSVLGIIDSVGAERERGLLQRRTWCAVAHDAEGRDREGLRLGDQGGCVVQSSAGLDSREGA